MKGPAIFLAQFAGSEAPFDTLENIRAPDKAFDDFAASGVDQRTIRRALGLSKDES